MPTSLIIVKRNTNLLKRTKILILENNELKYMVQACLKVQTKPVYLPKHGKNRDNKVRKKHESRAIPNGAR